MVGDDDGGGDDQAARGQKGTREATHTKEVESRDGSARYCSGLEAQRAIHGGRCERALQVIGSQPSIVTAPLATLFLRARPRPARAEFSRPATAPAPPEPGGCVIISSSSARPDTPAA